MNCYLFIIGIIIYGLLAFEIIRRKNILTYLALGISIFVLVYVTVSGLWFFCDRFTLNRALISTYLIGGVGGLINLVHLKKKHYIDDIFSEAKETLISSGEYLILLLILIISIPLCINQFEIYGMGQDEGVYQAKAFAILAGENSNRVDMDEYHFLTDEEKMQYVEFLDNFTGYYTKADFPAFMIDDQHCEVTGYYHGLPNMAALLALSAVFFGMQGMKTINIFIYLSILILVYEIAKLLGFKKVYRAILTISVALSPIVLWVSKSSLTENVLTLAVVLFVYLMYETEFLVLIPITAFCFFHISSFMMMPLFNVILWLMYLGRRNKKYIILNVSTLLSFAVGYWMMLTVSPEYADKNLGRLKDIGFRTDTLWLLPIIYAVAVILITLLIVYLCRNKKLPILKEDNIYKSKLIYWLIRIIILFAIVAVGRWIWSIHLLEPNDISGNNWLRLGYEGSDNLFSILQYSSLYAVCLMSGIVLVPLLIINIFLHPERFFTKNYMLLFVTFFYLLFICDSLVVNEVMYYYYYGRYLTYTIVIAILAVGMLLEKMNLRIGIILSAVGIAILLPFTFFLADHKDDSCIDDEILLSLSDSIAPDSAVIIDADRDITSVLWNLRALSGASIFPMFEDYEAELEHLKDKYMNVYLLTDCAVGNYGTLVYADNYIHREYSNRSSQSFIPLISSIEEQEKNLYLYDTDSDALKKNYLGDMSGIENGVIPKDGVMFGPYIRLLPGEYTLCIDVELLPAMEQNIQINADAGGVNILMTELHDGYNEIEFTADQRYENVEFVIFNVTGADIRINGIFLK